MLYLVFGAPPRRFALAGAEVLEVVPLVPLRELPETPPEVAGVFRYRGRLAPVIDLTRLLEGRPSIGQLSTRIIVLAYQRPGAETCRPLGAIAERATDTLRIDEEQLAPSGLGEAEAPYVGRLATVGQLSLSDRELLPVIDVPQLLPAPLREALFAEADAEEACRPANTARRPRGCEDDLGTRAVSAGPAPKEPR